MKVHQIYLAWLRNRSNILLLIGTTAFLTVIILQGVMLANIYQQSKRNEEILKGLSCILLIQPADRNKDNVTACVRNNETGISNFLFSSPDEMNLIKTLESESVIVAPVRGVAGAPGKNGKDGRDGTNGANGSNGVSTVSTFATETIIKEVPLQGEPGQPGKSTELRYNTAKSRIEWRYVGDDGWQILVDKCTLINSCETL